MYLGLDIGTTSICAIVLDNNGNTVFSKTLPNDFSISGKDYEKMQNADLIYETCKILYDEAKEKFDVKSVGISNQMHGILYVDENGNALSPLITWQDERGNLQRKNLSYAKELSLLTSYEMATGFGVTTLFFDFVNNNIPQKTRKICTIGDYVAMKLCNKKSPVMHQSNAHSLGLFNLKNGCWDKTAINKAGLDFSLFPQVESNVSLLGKTAENCNVYLAVGDNQASVYGVEQSDDTVIVNIGTGSQVSVICNQYIPAPSPCEIRPYVNGKYLIIGGALCGGYSYQLLKNFYDGIVKFFGKEITYDIMNNLAENAENQPTPIFNTKFRGTRKNPLLTASIENITENNFNAGAFTLALLKGIIGELKEFYQKIIDVIPKKSNLVGSGNAIRLNTVLQRIISDDFGASLKIPTHKEEAAFGAALIAAERYENKSLKNFIKY